MEDGKKLHMLVGRTKKKLLRGSSRILILHIDRSRDTQIRIHIILVRSFMSPGITLLILYCYYDMTSQ